MRDDPDADGPKHVYGFETLEKICKAFSGVAEPGEGADVDISTLPGGDDELVGARGAVIVWFEHLTPEAAIETAFEAELAW